jgi:poly(hydroxyalkanoate) depolymerase family esterase
MRNLGDTVSRLVQRRSQLDAASTIGAVGTQKLADLGDFGSNPGDLRAKYFVPAGLADGAALVVVLHGCGQSAADYDAGSGWSALAAEAGFALLLPEQTRSNNANLCFNWFAPADIRHGSGETLSIRQMIDAMVAAHGLDRRRIFVTGLSAGGAMAMALLSTAPHAFAGGAIIAGVPFGSAASMPEAFDRMRGLGLPSASSVAAMARAAAPDDGPWPTLSVWQGNRDNVVDAANAEAIALGWAQLHDASMEMREDSVNGHRHRVWRDASGVARVESYTLDGMGHGTPITVHGAEACGTPAPYILEAGISSTRRIAAFWGLAPVPMPMAAGADTGRVASRAVPKSAFPMPSGVEAIIDQAMRQAGLIR